MGSKAFESPLISHARMRAMYRALVETRILGERKGRRSATGWPRNFEACWVGTAIDLRENDLVSAGQAPWLIDYVRAIGARDAASSSTELAKAIAAGPKTPHAAFDRLLCAAGMAMALKAAGAGIVMAYVGVNDLTPAAWKRFLAVARDGELPLAIVATPGPAGLANADLSKIVKQMGANDIPVIPVDAADAVALYRVTQETLVRARADGGVAVIECVDCGLDPVALLGPQLVKKQVCTELWVAGIAPRFRERLARA